MRKKAAKPLTFSNSYQFTIVRGIFYNSQILDKKKITSGKVSTSFVEQLPRRGRPNSLGGNIFINKKTPDYIGQEQNALTTCCSVLSL